MMPRACSNLILAASGTESSASFKSIRRPVSALTDFVVKLAGQVTALGFLDFEQSSGKALEPGSVTLCCLSRLYQGMVCLSKLGDVLSGSDQAYWLARLIHDHTAPVMNHTTAAVRVGDSVIRTEVAALANCLVHERAHPIDILRLEAVEELLVGEVGPVRLEAEDVEQFIGPGDVIGAQVPFPTADVCNLLGLSESSFALLEFFQDLLALLLGDSRLLRDARSTSPLVSA